MLKVGYFGHERCDTMYYILRAAQILNLNSLVIDNSISGDFFRSLSDEEDVDTNALITILRNYKITDDFLDESEYDLFIYYVGLSSDSKIDCVFDRLFICPTQSYIVIKDTKAAIAGIRKDNIVLIYDDLTKTKITLETLKSELGMEGYDLGENEFELGLDETRIFKYETLTFTGEVALKGNTKDYANTVYNIIIKLFDVTDKRQVKQLKKNL